MSSNPQFNFVYTVASNDLSDIEYVDPATLKGVDKFVELIDGPGDYGVLGQYLMSNGGGLEWVNGTGGLTKFTQLSDCPNNYGSASQSLITDGLSNITYGPIIPEFVQQLANVANITGSDDHKMVVIDNTATGYIYKSLDLIVKDEVSFSTLKDVPSNYTIADAGKCVVVNPSGNGLVYSNLPAPSNFIGLTDTPSSYTGASNYKVRVKSDETGLEFVADSGGGGTDNFTQLLDVNLTYAQNTYKNPQVNYTQNKLIISSNGNTELTTPYFSSTTSSGTTKLWYSKILVHRPKLFFNYSFNSDTISPNNNRGYRGELVVSIDPPAVYSPHIRLGLNNARCNGPSTFTQTSTSPLTSTVWSYNESSGILLFKNPNVSNGLETHPLLPINTLLNFKCTINMGIQMSQTPNKDVMCILGLGYGTNNLGTNSQLINSCCCVCNGSSNNSKPSAGMQGTMSKTFYINVYPNPDLYFNLDLSLSLLNNSGTLPGSMDVVWYSWSLEEM